MVFALNDILNSLFSNSFFVLIFSFFIFGFSLGVLLLFYYGTTFGLCHYENFKKCRRGFFYRFKMKRIKRKKIKVVSCALEKVKFN